MTLQFVLGKDGLDHQAKMIEILKSQKVKNAGDQFFYLVPNHIKFESEVDILKQLGRLMLTQLLKVRFRCCHSRDWPGSFCETRQNTRSSESARLASIC